MKEQTRRRNPSRSRLAAVIRRNLERIEPYDTWAKKMNPTPEMKRLYLSVVQDFRMLLTMIETEVGTRH